MRYTWYDSPIGRLLVARDDAAVRRVAIPDRDPSRLDSPRRGERRPSEPAPAPAPGWILDDAGLAREVAELDAYFAGELREFEMAVAPEGTPFRRRVWAALARIPYGETWSYGDLARRRASAVGRRVRSERPTAPTPSPSSCPATGSSARTAASSATAAGSTARRGSSPTSGASPSSRTRPAA